MNASTLRSTVARPSLRLAALTDVGRVRSRNDDSVIAADLNPDAIALSGRMEVGDHGVLLAVADGMGGHADGDIASTIAVQEATESMRRSSGSGAECIRRAIEHAHRQIRDAAAERTGSDRMGTTLTAIHVDGTHAHIAHVGDSRAYVVRAGKIARLTQDQTVVEMLIDAGLLEEEDRETSPYAHQLMQCLGQMDRRLDVATSTLELREGDVLVLCSDGLTNLVDDEEIEAAVREGGPFEETCQGLVDLANLRGGDDNSTVLIAGVRGGLPRAMPGETVASTHHVVHAFRTPAMARML